MFKFDVRGFRSFFWYVVEEVDKDFGNDEEDDRKLSVI